jgi:hypothetical protein
MYVFTCFFIYLLLKSKQNNLAAGTPKKSLPCFGTRSPRKSAISASHSFPPFLRFDEEGLFVVMFFL